MLSPTLYHLTHGPLGVRVPAKGARPFLENILEQQPRTACDADDTGKSREPTERHHLFQQEFLLQKVSSVRLHSVLLRAVDRPGHQDDLGEHDDPVQHHAEHAQHDQCGPDQRRVELRIGGQ